MKFISIGPYCDTKEILKANNLTTEAYPFDYIFSSLDMVKHCINDKFNIFLDKKYFEPSTHNTAHKFYCKFLDTELLIKHHIKHNYSKTYKPSNGGLFTHHDLIQNSENYEKFKRRCGRLLDLIENNKKIVFVYYNCYTNQYQDLVDFYNSFFS